MSIRNDIYTVYKNKECRIGRIDNHYEVITNDTDSLDLGFIEYRPKENLRPRIFFKIVSPSEIGEVYEINTFCLYQGFEFHISYEENGEYVLVSDYSPLIEKLGFSRIDKYGYEKVVRKEDLDLIYEKKTLVTDFFD